jgi:hypothetical protein
MLSLGGTGKKENERGLTIIKASYGIQGNFTDVTGEVAGLIQDGELNFTVTPQQLGILDPAPGVIKELQIQHSINKGKKNLLTVKDNDQVLLSVPNIPDKSKDNNPSVLLGFMSSLWAAIIVFVVGVFALDSKFLGHNIFESPVLGWLFLALTIGTFGHFYIGILPIIIIIAAFWAK